MLKDIDPLLGPDLLWALRAMGHGDEIAVVDANFPAESNSRRVCRIESADAVATVRAIVSVMPLDDFGPAACRMAVVGAPDETPPVVLDFEAELEAVGYGGPLTALERSDFYARAKGAFAVVATGETRLYGNLILTKGVVRPAAA